MTKNETLKLALEALRRSKKAVSGNLDLAGCAYGRNDPDGHRYDDAKKALMTLDKAITAIKEALSPQRTWIGLDQTTKPDIRHQTEAFFAGVQWAETRLKELNT